MNECLRYMQLFLQAAAAAHFIRNSRRKCHRARKDRLFLEFYTDADGAMRLLLQCPKQLYASVTTFYDYTWQVASGFPSKISSSPPTGR
jgi:hypothetical protein